MSVETVDYSVSQKIPLTIKADVIVVGGGPGGLGAAVAAARNGADTVLIERYGSLGGMAFGGEVFPFVANHIDGKTLDKPIYSEWVNAMQQYHPDSGSQPDEDVRRIHNNFTKEEAMLAAEDLCLAAGVRLVYHHHLFDVVKKDGKITTAILFSKSGLTAAQAEVFIDCTGDGDLAVKAGCDYEYGNQDGLCQPMTLCFKLSGVDADRMPSRSEINVLYNQAKAAGEIQCLRENILLFLTPQKDIIHFNTTRIVKKHAVSGMDLSDAEIEGRRQCRQIFVFLKKRVPGFENSSFHSIASHIGIRESRRILCKQFIGVEAFEQAKKYPDGITRARYTIDIHNPEGTGTIIKSMPEQDWYEIPYGCIVAKDVSNLLVGGRSISVDHALHSSTRVMPIVCSVGQAAGVAAAMAVERHVCPNELDGAEVRAKLQKMGAVL